MSDWRDQRSQLSYYDLNPTAGPDQADHTDLRVWNPRITEGPRELSPYGTNGALGPDWKQLSYQLGNTAGDMRQFGQSQMSRIPGYYEAGNAYDASAQRAQDQWGGAYEKNLANYDAMGAQLGDLRAAAAGRVDSAAAKQQQAGLDAAMRSQMAMANSGPGGFNPAAQAAASRAGAEMQLQAAAGAAALRAQEQAQARAHLTAALGQQGQAGNALQSQAMGQQALLFGQGQQSFDQAMRSGQMGLAGYGMGLNYDAARQQLWGAQSANQLAHTQQNLDEQYRNAALKEQRRQFDQAAIDAQNARQAGIGQWMWGVGLNSLGKMMSVGGGGGDGGNIAGAPNYNKGY